ncbi:LacI family DNA-binding transcriptional regulator [Dictyobacter aurantiacus]|uniref:LacI family transcriptional regulator n=1 Tax=Dictyobacter aurantiacus TaxID=1936993 RepID=A0A401ZPZ1_9CHLR|nr:LacI family DNA-binding transcriptional regulator [Dictyobacter aurantiacus]GCE08935.1 LacI family transcriptional regulator [Dictyobacter aurantiacus]
MSEKLNIQDIARLANVSTGTVSRVLNNKPDVSPATRERILRIVEEQGYVPSSTAVGLVSGRSRLISVLVPALTWPLIPEMMVKVAEIVEGTPYEIVLYSISSSNHLSDCGKVIDRILATRLTAGMLAIFPGQSAQHLTHLQRQGFPVVLIDDQHAPVEGVPWIGVDNRGGAYEATRYLIALGHQRIACIQGPMKYKVSRDRYQGYQDALRDAGIPLDPALVLEGDFMLSGGRQGARELLARPKSERPTAIFAQSDLMAYGVMSAAAEFGLSIPKDISLMGFDDNPSSAHMQPALTTVQQPCTEMGQQAIELLLQLIEEPHLYYRQQPEDKKQDLTEYAPRIQLPTNLMIRDTCRKLSKRALQTPDRHQQAVSG